jgi:C1A family cysteine protease
MTKEKKRAPPFSPIIFSITFPPEPGRAIVSAMKKMTLLLVLMAPPKSFARTLPSKYTELLAYVQPAPDQGDTNTCWFMASTGAMELLLNKKDHITNPKISGKNDLSESFLIWQDDYIERANRPEHFIQEVVLRFNYGEAIHQSAWPFHAYRRDGSTNSEVWSRHPDFEQLPRLKVPPLKTDLLFARGKKYATYVLKPEDVEKVKETLVKTSSPVIINYNEDGYWHVILIVGYDDHLKGECYEITPQECNPMGSFYVRDSNGKHYEARAYNWFLYKANAAASVQFK